MGLSHKHSPLLFAIQLLFVHCRPVYTVLRLPHRHMHSLEVIEMSSLGHVTDESCFMFILKREWASTHVGCG